MYFKQFAPRFAAAEMMVRELIGSEMKVARSEVKNTKEKNIAAVRRGMRQSIERKDTQCCECLGYDHMIYQPTYLIFKVDGDCTVIITKFLIN